MAISTIIRPDSGSGGIAQHLRNGGSANWSRCSEASSDGDTTYVYQSNLAGGGATLASDLYRFGNPSRSGQILSVTLKAQARYAGPGNTREIQLQARVNGVYATGSFVQLGISYAEYSLSLPLQPSGAAWDWDALDAFYGGFLTTAEGDGISATESRVTQLFLEISSNQGWQASSGTISLLGGSTTASSAAGDNPEEEGFSLQAGRSPEFEGQITRSRGFELRGSGSASFNVQAGRSPAFSGEISRAWDPELQK